MIEWNGIFLWSNAVITVEWQHADSLCVYLILGKILMGD